MIHWDFVIFHDAIRNNFVLNRKSHHTFCKIKNHPSRHFFKPTWNMASRIYQYMLCDCFVIVRLLPRWLMWLQFPNIFYNIKKILKVCICRRYKSYFLKCYFLKQRQIVKPTNLQQFTCYNERAWNGSTS